MKQFTFLVLFAFALCTSQAQTFDEWFRQKATQKKYLLQQIAALKVYLAYVQKGYAIAQKGLTTISAIKQGEFDIHRDFFGSLKDVNSKIARYARVEETITMQLKIVQVYKDVRRHVKGYNLFNENEVDYTLKVFENVLKDCSELIMDLIAVITSNNLEMKDDERVKRIDRLYTDMQDAYVFSQAFGNEVKLLGLQRMKEQSDVQTSRALHDIRNE
jgi:hypothetical protein